MKTTFLPYLIGTIVLISSCTKKAQHAADYNDTIVKQQLNIIHAFDLLDSTLKDTLALKERSDYAFINLQTSIKRSLLELDSVGSFEKDPSLQIAARELFRTYENIALTEYGSLLQIKYTPAEKVTVLLADSSVSVQRRIHDTSEKAQDRFLKSQEDFGKKYNLTFE